MVGVRCSGLVALVLVALACRVRGEVKYKLRHDVAVLSSDASSNVQRNAASARHCARMCSGDGACAAANYENGTCEMLMAEPMAEVEARPGSIALVDTHCLPDPCQNGGLCTFDDVGQFQCTCVGSFMGTFCEETNPCIPTPCQNGGACTPNSPETYTCACSIHFMGSNCETPNPCGPVTCQNGGACVIVDPSTYRCDCVGNYAGTHCEKLYVLSIKVDDEGAVYSKGQVLHNTFAIGGGQAGTTYSVNLNTDVLVLKKWNNGGPGPVTASVNGVAVSGWRCVNNFGFNDDPETRYPGSTWPDYDDSGWTAGLIGYEHFGQLCRAKLTM